MAETIAAIATAIGRGGISIVRISGDSAADIAGKLFAAANGVSAADMESHRLYLGRVLDEQGRLIDRALAVIMRGPHSYTGEDVAEFQLHGGMQVTAALLSAVIASGARLATPGEFTLRAYLAGRIDLAQAEAVADLIDAKTPRSSRMAAQQVDGSLRRLIEGIEQRLTDLQADITAGVDFPDEVDALAADELQRRLDETLAVIENALKQAPAGRALRDGVSCALIGEVNVGKSSLLNGLLNRDRAIVTHLPGTTRDVLTETLDLDGLPLLLSDTAGLRDDATDEAERIGIERSEAARDSARLLLLVLDATRGLTEAAADLLRRSKQRDRIVVINKCDVADGKPLYNKLLVQDELALAPENIILASAKTGQGLDQLKQAIFRIAQLVDTESDSLLLSNARHEQALLRAADALRSARQTVRNDLPADLVTVDLDSALCSLGEITGKTAGDFVLTQIFSRFCVGK